MAKKALKIFNKEFSLNSLFAIFLTIGLLDLVALSIEPMPGVLPLAMTLSMLALITVFHHIFPGSMFFNVVLANSITIYACLYVFFLESNFMPVGGAAITIGFVMPLAAFLCGAMWREREIRKVVTSERLSDHGEFARTFLWLIPVMAVGVSTFIVPLEEISVEQREYWLFGSMALISLVVILVSHEVAVFLLDIGVLFGDFFITVAKLVKPAFAFFTCYSLIVIVYASIYRIIDRVSDTANFAIEGVTRDIQFIESLYFSIVTVSTLGYGDIVPLTYAVRLIVGAQIFSGVLLILFGVHAILGHSASHKPR